MLHTRSARSMVASVLLGAALALAQASASAATSLSFYDITHGNAGAEADGEANLSVEVLDLGGNQVRFKFTNNSSSSLTDVYFDDGTLLGIASISFSSGVSFSQGATPTNLSGANLTTPAFQVTQGFSADSNNPVGQNGVSQNEWLAIDFSLLSGKTFNDTLAALMLPNGGGTGDLRIGVRVQNFASGGSGESFISNAISPVPEPGSFGMLLGGLGMISMMMLRGKYRQ
jgi:hypothetical protein